MSHLKRYLSCIYIPLALMGVAIAQDATCDYMTNLAKVEGGGNLSATNANSTATGLYQLTEAALETCGYFTQTSKVTSSDYGTGEFSNGTWTGKNGITSRAAFMADASAQQSCASQYSSLSYNSLSSATKSDVGSSIPGTSSTVTESGLAACSYVAGVGGCNRFMSTGTTGNSSEDANLRARMENAGDKDASCVTGDKDSTQYNGDSVDIGAGQGNNVGVYCNPKVAKALALSGAQAAQNWKNLAGSNGIGYTMVDGSGLNNAAGINGAKTADGMPFFQRLGRSYGYQALSCINQIMNSGILPWFNIPDIADILAMLESFVCSEMENLFDDVAEPIDSALYSNTSFGNMGGFLPDMGLGSLGGGVTVVQGQGSLVNLNGNTFGTDYGDNSAVDSVNNTLGEANSAVDDYINSVPFLNGDTSWAGISHMYSTPSSVNMASPGMTITSGK